jgi:hypothetical protein
MYIYNTNNKDYHRYVHNLDIYESKPSMVGLSSIKQIGNNTHFRKELKDVRTEGSSYSADYEYLNDEFSDIGYW